LLPLPKQQTGPMDTGFWVCASWDCQTTLRHFKPKAAGTSLGFNPFRALQRRPWSDFADAPLACFAEPADILDGSAGISEYQ
jgi:hypothetical protein